MLAPRLIKPRRKLRGDGWALHEVLNYESTHHYGVPAWYFDANNLPVFETQHTYLMRDKLLRRRRSARLRSHSGIRSGLCPQEVVEGAR
jgi:hypothetical protein